MFPIRIYVGKVFPGEGYKSVPGSNKKRERERIKEISNEKKRNETNNSEWKHDFQWSAWSPTAKI